MTQCNCSICRRYGAIWGYYTRAIVDINAKPGSLAVYRWGDNDINFYHCSRCGCVTHHGRVVEKADATDTLAINMRNADDTRLAGSIPVKMLDGAGTWGVLDCCALPDVFHSR
jgi:hypothetical protein